MKVPRESKDLINLLDTIYPDRLDIDDTKSKRERYRLEGKVELIRQLKLGLKLLEEKEVDASTSR